MVGKFRVDEIDPRRPVPIVALAKSGSAAAPSREYYAERTQSQ